MIIERHDMKRTHSGLHSQRNTILILVSVLIIASIDAAAGRSAAASIIGKQDQSGIALSGVVTDSVCGGTHGTKTHGDAECTRVCVELGAGYALAIGKKTYALKGHEPELNRFAGDRVLVEGKVVGPDTVAVESVVPWVVDAACGTPAQDAFERCADTRR
jgi:hypothetical protein